MKKMTVSLAAMMFVLTLGLSVAFAGDEGKMPYNGVTDFGSAPAANNPETATVDNKQPYNGITFFEPSPAPASKAASSEAGAGGTRAEKEPYNGVTVFSKS